MPKFFESGGGGYGNNDDGQGLAILYGAPWLADASLNYSPIDRRLHLWTGGGDMKSIDADGLLDLVTLHGTGQIRRASLGTSTWTQDELAVWPFTTASASTIR